MLTLKEHRFVSEYLVDFVAGEAAKRAGYSAKTAPQAASRLLRKPEIRDAIEAKKAQMVKATDLSAARVLEELRRLAFADVRGLFDEQGNLRPIKDLTPEQAAAIAAVEVVHRNLKSGDGEVDTVIKVKAWDKTRSLEMLAKHFGLLTEKVQHSGAVQFLHEMP